MTVGAITILLVNSPKNPLLSAFHIFIWSEKWLIIGSHILYLCLPKQFKYKSSSGVFWLPVCQCTGNIFPSFKVISLCDLSYMGYFCAFFSVYVGPGRIFAILSFPFLLPLPCHYVEGDISVPTGNTSQRWPLSHRYTKRAVHLWQANVRSGARSENLREERRNLSSWQMHKGHRIIEFFVLEEPLKIT